MSYRFRPNGHFNRRNFRAPKTDHSVVSAIIAGQAKHAQNPIAQKEDYVCKNSFEDFAISHQLKQNIGHKKYVTPTPIQDQAIPIILSGRDIIGIANTGTGKTAAFLIPLIDKVFRDKSQKVLIITPTRELALQISDELRGFSYSLGLNSVLCIGGANMKKQINQLIYRPNFVIGTPGRIKDLIRQRCLDLSQFSNVVLDEADRMVDIGFIADIKYFISLLAKERQSLFFSATISGKVRGILESFVTNPVTISTKQGETVDNIKQELIRVTNQPRVDVLHDLLIKDGFDKVLIFGRTKRGVQKLTAELNSRGFKTGVIHGNKTQGQRQKALDMFKRNQIQILLATDVASRGLDIENVSHVINYDMPASYDDYIHRIGRTGRANKTGIALTFV